MTATPWFERFIPPAPEQIRLFHPQDLHITIFFLGAVDQQRALQAWNRLSWNLSALKITLSNVVPMGTAHRYSALSALVDDGRQPIEQAILQCRDALALAADVPSESRPPKAHITIARASRKATPEQRLQAIRWANTINLRKYPVLLDSVALYTWHHDRPLRQFRIVQSRKL